MFDVSWSEILVVGIVALLVVGPKELPTLLRTVGKYLGLIKRQAAEFRAQFDEAMRDSELEQLKKDVENIKAEAEGSLRDVERSVETEMSDARREFDSVAKGVNSSDYDPAAHDANGLPFPIDDVGTAPAIDAPRAPSGPGAAAIAAAAAASAPPSSVSAGPSSGPSTATVTPAPANVGA